MDESGFDVGRFLHDVDENLVCPICTGVFNSPSVLSCGHSFCKVQIEKHFKIIKILAFVFVFVLVLH